MVILRIRFPARRYHATPWDAHVNEGRVEWPPSPWRLLRGLLAVGYTKLGWTTEPTADALSLIDKLAEHAPAFALPVATEAHSRHYMPTRGNPAKVFDAFLRFESPDSELLIRYEVDLSEAEVRILEQLTAGLTYLGRAESWVEAEVMPAEDTEAVCQSRSWSCPAQRRSEDPTQLARGRRVRLMAALPQQQFVDWRGEQIETLFAAQQQAESEKLAAKGKSLTAATIKKIRSRVELSLPIDRLQTLQAETASWQSQGWPQPPGSRWIDYVVPDDRLQTPPLSPLPYTSASESVNAVLFAIDGDGKRGSVRPLMRRALPLMELLHHMAVYKATQGLGLGNVWALTGKADDGTRLSGHQHAHWLPLSLLGSDNHLLGANRIDHVLVYAPGGLSHQAVAALSGIRWAYSKHISRLSVNVAGLGSICDLSEQIGRSAQLNRCGALSLQSGRVWESATPLVLRKHLHKRGKKTVEGQIREELQERGFDEPVSVQVWSAEQMVQRRLKRFVLQRSAGKQQPPHIASWAATIEFATEQAAPISLGYASHLGLGLFRSCPDAS